MLDPIAAARPRIGRFESSLQSFTTSDGREYYINFEFENEQREPSYSGGVTQAWPVYVAEVDGSVVDPEQFEHELDAHDKKRLRSAMIDQAERYLQQQLEI